MLVYLEKTNRYERKEIKFEIKKSKSSSRSAKSMEVFKSPDLAENIKTVLFPGLANVGPSALIYSFFSQTDRVQFSRVNKLSLQSIMNHQKFRNEMLAKLIKSEYPEEYSEALRLTTIQEEDVASINWIKIHSSILKKEKNINVDRELFKTIKTKKLTEITYQPRQLLFRIDHNYRSAIYWIEKRFANKELLKSLYQNVLAERSKISEDTPDKYGLTLVDWAIFLKQHTEIERLLAIGRPVDGGQLGLLLAIFNNDQISIRLLISVPDLPSINQHSDIVLLQLAIRNNHLDVVKKIRVGRPDQPEYFYEPPTLISNFKNNVNLTFNLGPFHLAARHGHLEIMNYFLSIPQWRHHMKQVFQFDEYNESYFNINYYPIDLAAAYAHNKMVENLLAMNVKINVAFRMILKKNYIETLRVMLSKKTKEFGDGHTVFDSALTETNNSKILQIIFDARIAAYQDHYQDKSNTLEFKASTPINKIRQLKLRSIQWLKEVVATKKGLELQAELEKMKNHDFFQKSFLYSTKHSIIDCFKMIGSTFVEIGPEFMGGPQEPVPVESLRYHDFDIGNLYLHAKKIAEWQIKFVASKKNSEYKKEMKQISKDTEAQPPIDSISALSIGLCYVAK